MLVVFFDVEIGMLINFIIRIVECDEIDFIVMGVKGEYSMIEKVFGCVFLGVVKNVNMFVLLVLEEVIFKLVKNVVYVFNFLDIDVYYIW